jgi:ribosomal protein S27E
MSAPARKSLALYADALAAARELIRLGARPALLADLCGLDRASALRLYRELTGERAKSGQMPNDHLWAIKSANCCLHASLFLGIHQDVKAAARPDTPHHQVFLAAYRTYLAVAESVTDDCACARLSVQRAWLIERHGRGLEIRLIRCVKCRSRHVVFSTGAGHFGKCPICDVRLDKLGRRRWVSPFPHTVEGGRRPPKP